MVQPARPSSVSSVQPDECRTASLLRFAVLIAGSAPGTSEILDKMFLVACLVSSGPRITEGTGPDKCNPLTIHPNTSFAVALQVEPEAARQNFS